jgi:hypothetical protein
MTSQVERLSLIGERLWLAGEDLERMNEDGPRNAAVEVGVEKRLRLWGSRGEKSGA